MGGKTIVLCLSVLVFFVASASSYVVVVKVPDPSYSVEIQNNNNEDVILIEGDSSNSLIENWYNWYNVDTSESDEADTPCGTTDKEYKYFESTRSCYKVHTDRATWNDAEATCFQEGGHLAVINNLDEAQILAEQFPSGFRVVHMGFHWVEDFKIWFATSGQTLAEAGYVNWSVGEPNNISGDQYCGSMYPNRSFDDITCSDETAFICEIKTFRSHQDPTTEPETFDTTTDIVQNYSSEEQGSSVTESSSEPTSVEDRNDCGTADPEYTFFDGTKSCYKVHTDRKTWDDAKATCVREGGHLAVINSHDEVAFIVKKLTFPVTEVYLGFHWRDVFWMNIQGQSLAETGYENWYPATTGAYLWLGEALCGTLFYTGTSNYISCEYEGAFVCEKDSSSQVLPATTEDLTNFVTTEKDDTSEELNTPNMETSSQPTSTETQNECGTADTEYKFFESTQSCYKFHTDRATWNDAEATCVREGGHLAVIDSRNEADFILSHIARGFVFWLGLYVNDASWMTIHGQTLTEAGYEHWLEGEPIAAEGVCGVMFMFTNGSYSDTYCFMVMDFICEKDSSSRLQLSTTTESQNNVDTTEIDDTSEEVKTPDMETSSQPTSIETQNECGTTDTEYILFESTNSCYKVHTDGATWNDAEATCVREGGHLAVINSQDEADFVMNRISRDSLAIWLGFYVKDASWMTTHGQTLTEAGYENWLGGQPSADDGICGAMYMDGIFTNIYCHVAMDFICEKDSKSRLQLSTTTEAQTNIDTIGTEYRFFESTKSYYKVHTKPASWEAAEATCVEEGGHLAVINSQEEADFFTKHFPPYSYQVFLGFHRISDSWLTVQGKTLAEAGYENWNQGEPNNLAGAQECGSMYPDGTFDDIECYGQLAFICERNSYLEYHPDTTTTTEVQDKLNPLYADYYEYDTLYDEKPSTVMLAVKKTDMSKNKCGTWDKKYTFYDITQSCYKVHTDRATWNDAEATCVREGGHLAVINSRNEADTLTTLYPEGAEHVFVGFSYREQDSLNSSDMFEIRHNGEWLTIDGQTLSEAGYENWTPGEPNNAGGREYCGTIYGNGKFDDAACYNEFDFICEIKPKSY